MKYEEREEGNNQQGIQFEESNPDSAFNPTEDKPISSTSSSSNTNVTTASTGNSGNPGSPKKYAFSRTNELAAMLAKVKHIPAVGEESNDDNDGNEKMDEQREAPPLPNSRPSCLPQEMSSTMPTTVCDNKEKGKTMTIDPVRMSDIEEQSAYLGDGNVQVKEEKENQQQQPDIYDKEEEDEGRDEEDEISPDVSELPVDEKNIPKSRDTMASLNEFFERENYADIIAATMYADNRESNSDYELDASATGTIPSKTISFTLPPTLVLPPTQLQTQTLSQSQTQTQTLPHVQVEKEQEKQEKQEKQVGGEKVDLDATLEDDHMFDDIVNSINLDDIDVETLMNDLSMDDLTISFNTTKKDTNKEKKEEEKTVDHAPAVVGESENINEDGHCNDDKDGEQNANSSGQNILMQPIGIEVGFVFAWYWNDSSMFYLRNIYSMYILTSSVLFSMILKQKMNKS